jgi:hypothetical protein
MNSSDPILPREIPIIRKIIQDETWLEGERRGCLVRPDDHVVRENVCQVILRVGQQLRESLTGSGPVVIGLPGNDAPRGSDSN